MNYFEAEEGDETLFQLYRMYGYEPTGLFTFDRLVGLAIDIPCALCSRPFETDLRFSRWPITGLCGHAICKGCHTEAILFQPKQGKLQPCPLDGCTSGASFVIEPSPDKPLLFAIQRLEDIEYRTGSKFRSLFDREQKVKEPYQRKVEIAEAKVAEMIKYTRQVMKLCNDPDAELDESDEEKTLEIVRKGNARDSKPSARKSLDELLSMASTESTDSVDDSIELMPPPPKKPLITTKAAPPERRFRLPRVSIENKNQQPTRTDIESVNSSSSSDSESTQEAEFV